MKSPNDAFLRTNPPHEVMHICKSAKVKGKVYPVTCLEGKEVQ